MSYDPNDPLIVMSDALNELAGHPYCGVACEHGGACTLATGHDGNHQAAGLTDAVIYCEWPQ